MSTLIPVLVLATFLALAFVPTAAADPIERTCRTVADNPWAPQPLNCTAHQGLLEPLPTIYQVCRAVADNPWAPQPINCNLF